MALDDLRVFVAVCAAGNLSAVAHELNRQHVKRLERELGLPLLERRPRGVEAAVRQVCMPIGPVRVWLRSG